MNQLTPHLATRKVIADDHTTGKKKIFYLTEIEFAEIWEDVQKRKTHIWIQGETFRPSQLKFAKFDQHDRDVLISKNDIVWIKETYLCQSLKGKGVYLKQRLRRNPNGTDTEIARWYCGYLKGKEIIITNNGGKLDKLCKNNVADK